MAANAVAIAQQLLRLAPPVIELVGEVVDAVTYSKTKRDAARRIITVAAKKLLTG